MTTAVATATSDSSAAAAATGAGPFSYFWNHSLKNPYANCIKFISNYANSPKASLESTSSSSPATVTPAPTATTGSGGELPAHPSQPSVSQLLPQTQRQRKDPQIVTSTSSSLRLSPHSASDVSQSTCRVHEAKACTSSSLPQESKEIFRSPFGLDAIAIEMLVPASMTPGIITRGTQGFKVKAEVRTRKPLFQDGPDLRSCAPSAFAGHFTKMKTLRKGGYV